MLCACRVLVTLCGEAGLSLVEVTSPRGGWKVLRITQHVRSCKVREKMEAGGRRRADEGGDAAFSEMQAQASAPESAPEERGCKRETVPCH